MKWYEEHPPIPEDDELTPEQVQIKRHLENAIKEIESVYEVLGLVPGLFDTLSMAHACIDTCLHHLLKYKPLTDEEKAEEERIKEYEERQKQFDSEVWGYADERS